MFEVGFVERLPFGEWAKCGLGRTGWWPVEVG
jgi:hypothetical protein